MTSMIFLYLTILTLIVAAIFDLKDQEVDWRILTFGIITALIYGYFKGNYINTLYSFLAVTVIPLGLVLVSRERWMGWGDVFFAIILALIVGYPKSLVALLIAFFGASIFGIIYLSFKPTQKNIPFGPFLVLGCLLALIFRQSIIAISLSSSIF